MTVKLLLLGSIRTQSPIHQKPAGIHFTVCPKADSLYTIVSVASIAAKVTRDRCPTLLDGQTGSGYPSDPTCQKWLQDNVDRVFGYPDNVRYVSGCVNPVEVLARAVHSCWTLLMRLTLTEAKNVAV